ncbi:MAG: radical SAM protein [Clostridia bacterium]|nr:radical SAM protein [Clostridia bacterium]
MANIVLTNRCNLKCPYCFASDFTSAKGQDMSIDNFIKALDFSAPDGEVGLIGGEPLIYENIDTVLDILKNDYRFRRINIYTNGVFIDKHIHFLTDPRFHILINVNSSSDIGKSFYERTDKNIDLLCKAGMHSHVTLGINIYKEDQDFSEFLFLIKKYGFDRIRTCVTIPSKRDECSQNYFFRMKKTMFSLYKKLYKMDVAPCYDCNVIPSCIYSDDEKAFLLKMPYISQRERALLLGEACVCSPIIDIYPDLTATRCFGCSSEAQANILDFDNINDLKNYFFMWVDSKKVHTLSRPECKDCYKFNTFACFGGCLCYK